MADISSKSPKKGIIFTVIIAVAIGLLLLTIASRLRDKKRETIQLPPSSTPAQVK